jgi:hypothetical protein
MCLLIQRVAATALKARLSMMFLACRALQRQANDNAQWFSHLQHEINMLSTVSRNRNVVQVRHVP